MSSSSTEVIQNTFSLQTQALSSESVQTWSIQALDSFTSPFYLLVMTGFVVFWIGLTGIFFNRRLVISILLAVELTLLSINLLMLTFSASLGDLMGVLFALYILCVAAAESAIGLALIIIWYRVRRTVNVQYISLLKG